MKEELEAEITAMEDEIKKVMGDEELLTAGACYPFHTREWYGRGIALSVVISGDQATDS